MIGSEPFQEERDETPLCLALSLSVSTDREGDCLKITKWVLTRHHM